MRIIRIAAGLVTTIAIVVILITGKKLLIPLLLALLVWFLIREIRKGLGKIGLRGWFFPRWAQSILATLIIFGLLGVVVNMLTVNIQELSESMQTYQSNVSVLASKLKEMFGIDLISMTQDYSQDFNFSEWLGALLSSLTDIFKRTFTIVLYTLFLLLEENAFYYKLQALYPQKDRLDNAQRIIQKVEKSISSYLTLKSLMSLLTAVLSYFALLFIGIDAPLFWAFLILLLNYIPTIGSLIATCFPAIFALLQFGDFTPCLLVLGVVGAVQVFVGNILEPRLMGDSLNISPMVVLLALAFWGALWGVTGMILSVPITVMMVIVFAEYETTRPIAILLSEKGQLKQEQTNPPPPEEQPTEEVLPPTKDNPTDPAA